MPTDQVRQHQATAAVGLGLVAAGAQRRARGLRHLDPALKGRQERYPEAARLVLGRGAPQHKAAVKDWAVGSVVGAAGAPAATQGVLGLRHDRQERLRHQRRFDRIRTAFGKGDPWDPYDFIATGVKGAVNANKSTYGPKAKKTSKPEKALIGAGVLGASALGGQVSRKIAPRVLRPGLHPAAHAVTGTVAGVAGIEPSRKIASHIVNRKKKMAVKPSSKSITVEGRDNHPVRKMMDASEVHVNRPLMLPTGRKKTLKTPAAITVKKAVTEETPESRAAAHRQMRRKKRQFGLGVVATSGGTVALGGSLAGRKAIARRLPKNIVSGAKNVGMHGGAVAGVAGTAAALQGIAIQHHDLKRQTQLLPPKP